MMKTMIPSIAALALLALRAGSASAMPAYLSVRQEQRGCCNGMGGPVEEEPAVVVEHFVDPAGEWRRWVAPTDANFERRYAPRPAPSLNPITLGF